MQQVDISLDRLRDPFGIGNGRDGCRTPMQWDGTALGGFSNVEPLRYHWGAFPSHKCSELTG